MKKYTVAVVQMDSQDNKENNIRFMLKAVETAAARGASLIVFPEMSLYQGNDPKENAESIPGSSIRIFQEAAKRHHILIHTGSCWETDGEDIFNTSVLIDPTGKIICKYRKLHLFDVNLKDFRYLESDRNQAGNEIVLADTVLGRMGLTICYDLRFPELFRIQALQGAELILLPASFVLNTGKDHWEPLLRARAIENSVYILAPNQIGKKTDGCNAYGRSMIIDPWGNVVSMASDRPGIVYADIDLEIAEAAERQIQGMENRRADIYTLNTENLKIYSADSD